uniref:EIF3g domain-containing protein n=1 Tax=Caenorhabditis tropicalis TaxID=1561998 RepID=A0A1I7U251_9PELO
MTEAVPLVPNNRGQNNPTFKDIKQTTEASMTTMPKYNGESDDISFVKKTTESGGLRKDARRLSKLKYEQLSNEQKADFALLTQALSDRLRTQQGANKALNEFTSTKMNRLIELTKEDLEQKGAKDGEPAKKKQRIGCSYCRGPHSTQSCQIMDAKTRMVYAMDNGICIIGYIRDTAIDLQRARSVNGLT